MQPLSGTHQSRLWLKDTAQALSQPLIGEDGPTVNDVLDYYRENGRLPSGPQGETVQINNRTMLKFKRDYFDRVRSKDNSDTDLEPTDGHIRFGKDSSQVHTEVHFEGTSKNGAYSMVRDTERGSKIFTESIFDGKSNKELTIAVRDSGTTIYEQTQTGVGVFRKMTKRTDLELDQAQLSGLMGEWRGIIGD